MGSGSIGLYRVLVLIANTGKLPMVSLGLALSFGFYSLIKKGLGFPVT